MNQRRIRVNELLCLPYLLEPRSLFLLAALLLGGCSWFSSSEENSLVPSDHQSMVFPRWFSSSGPYAQPDSLGDSYPHLFFDPVVEVDVLNKTLPFIPVTPQGSEFLYELDLALGRIYRQEFFCPQEDPLNNYKGTLKDIPFTLGIVPQYFDQLGLIQKIIVFGDKGKYQKNIDRGDSNLSVLQKNPPHSFQVKVLGGYLEQYCPKTRCTQSADWLTRLVLVARDLEDNRLKGIETLKDFKKENDWAKIKAFLEALGGRNFWASQSTSRVKITGEVESRQALKFLLSKSKKFHPEQQEKIKRSCQGLYDKTWNTFSPSLVPDGPLDQESKGKNFFSAFLTFLKSYRAPFMTCLDFVAPSNINHDPQRHWFFAHLSGFMRLIKDGGRYDCSRGFWYEQEKDNKEGLENWVGGLERCQQIHLDQAFNLIPKEMEKRRDQGRPYWEYLEYDSGFGGTHEKIYSWVRRENHRFLCKDSKMSWDKMRQGALFPKDVQWKMLGTKTKKEELIR